MSANGACADLVTLGAQRPPYSVVRVGRVTKRITQHLGVSVVKFGKQVADRAAWPFQGAAMCGKRLGKVHATVPSDFNPSRLMTAAASLVVMPGAMLKCIASGTLR